MRGEPVPPELAEFSARVAGRLRELADATPGPLRPPVLALAARPGKRLRSTLLGACARFGPADMTRTVRLGALVELLHLASLVHDDVIDDAAVRRGGPAAHIVVGRDLAMLAGLACFAQAGLEAAELGGGLDAVISRTVAGLAYGELLDVERAFDVTLSIPDYLELVERKTGDLFRLSCLLGAVEAGADPDVAQALGAFGTDLGVAFQILDDCLDLDTYGLGKPAGTDHLLGLFGAPTLSALAQDESGELAALLLSPSLSGKDMTTVRELVTRHGGLRAAAALARDRYERAVASLAGLADRGPRDVLVAVGEAVWAGRR